MTGGEKVSYSAISCKSCQRRKVKCDRCIPHCAICYKSGQSCSYASARLKPGPKIGTSQRSRKRADIRGCSKNAMVDDSIQFRIRCPDRRLRQNIRQEDQLDNSIGRAVQPSLLVGDASPSLEHCRLHNHWPTVTASHDSTGTSTPNPVTAQDLSLLVHPSHETTNFLNKRDCDGPRKVCSPINVNGDTHAIACHALKVSAKHVQRLVDLFHENMTSFSLFHKPSFRAKLDGITSVTQRCALLSAMISYAVRFDKDMCLSQKRETGEQLDPSLSVQHFSDLAIDFAEKALKECADDPPPLCLLQAFVINTFQLLIKGVRGKAWRSLGTCVRLAYELRLHLTDTSDIGMTSEIDVIQWSADEERRRAWWAIWELDTFASTVKRCPTGIDWSHIKTFLPIKDELWFSQKYQRSSYLAIRPIDRWKVLQESANDSPKAWYIVVNSLMRDSQSLPIQGPEIQAPLPVGSPSSTSRSREESFGKNEISEKLTILNHALHCFKLTLPRNLQYHGEYLSFTSPDPDAAVAARHIDSMKYIIYVMEQLTKFMIYHQQAFAGMCGRSQSDGTLTNMPVQSNSLSDRRVSNQSVKGLDNNALTSYLSASDSILAIIKRSAEDHVQHVNPLLASTIWLAAAAQLIYKVFGPPEANRDLADSKFDVLQLHHRMFVDFWNTPQLLQQKLESLEEQLERLRTTCHRSKAQNHNKGDATISNLQTVSRQPGPELASIDLQLQPGAHPIQTTTYSANTDDARNSNTTICTTVAIETGDDNEKSIEPQTQVPIATLNRPMGEAIGNSSSAALLESNSFEDLDYGIEWDFGFNDEISFHLDGLLSGPFI